MPPDGPAGKPRRPKWRRIIFRSFALASLLLLCGWALLRFAGIPSPILRQLESQLRVRGFQVHVQRAWLSRWNQLTATGLFAHPSQPLVLSADRAWITFRISKAAPFLQIQSAIADGLQLSTSPQPDSPSQSLFKSSRAAAQLNGLDLLQFNAADATFLGAKLVVTGRLAHPTQFHWTASSQKTPKRPPLPWEEWLKKTKLDPGSEIILSIDGDALARTFDIQLKVDSRRLAAMSGALTNAQMKLTAARNSKETNKISGTIHGTISALSLTNFSVTGATIDGSGSIDLLHPEQPILSISSQIASIRFKDNAARDLHWNLATSIAPPSSVRADLRGTVQQATHSKGQIEQFEFQLSTITTNLAALHSPVSWNGRAAAIQTAWGKSGDTTFKGSLSWLTNTPPELPQFLSAAAPLHLEGQFQATQLQSPKIVIDQLRGGLDWTAPHLRIHSLDAALYDGTLTASAALNAATRQVNSEVDFQFAVHRLAPLLTTNANNWLNQFSWKTPPKVHGRASLILPPWTNSPPQWHRQVLPTVTIAGVFSGAGAFRGIPCTAASSSFFLTNLFWTLPNLEVRRPEGVSHLDYRWNMDSQEFHWTLSSQVEPAALKPILPKDAQHILDEFHFSTAPSASGEISGRWHHPEEIQFSAAFRARDFSFRDQPVNELSGNVRYAKSVFEFNQVYARQGTGEIHAPYALIDLNQHALFLTNGTSTIDADSGGRMIGPKIYADLKPYHFRLPPLVQAHGWIPIRRHSRADVHFQVQGREFSYWKFTVPEISGNLWWHGDYLSITNVEAPFYNGHLSWIGNFDFSPPKGANFTFSGKAKHADLHLIMSDLLDPSNHLSGTLDSDFQISSAHSSNRSTWEGFGQAELQDGFLWGIPIFGFFSPVLDRISPGLGNSSITSGKASFTLQHSQVRTENLSLRSPALRLDYRGTVDLDGNVDALLEAEILRDAWVFGRVFSILLWPLEKAFQYRLTGTIFHPQSDPVYIPKIFLMPLHPIRSFRKLFHPHSEFRFPGSPDKSQDQYPQNYSVPSKSNKSMGLDKTK